MAMTRFIAMSSLPTTTNRSSGLAFRRSCTSLSLSTSGSPLRLRYLTAASLRLFTPAHSTAVRAFTTRQTSSSFNDPNQPPEETILEDDGLDQNMHWVIVMDEPEGYPTRSEIIKSYVKTLASVVGSEEAARLRIFVESTRHYFAFAAVLSKEILDKVKVLPRVRAVEPYTDNGFDHWVILMDDLDGNPTRDEIIDRYIKTLAVVVGSLYNVLETAIFSEEEARKKIYFVSTKHYSAFGALISQEIAYKMLDMPEVAMVGPDSIVSVTHCGGEPFINGQAVPYDPKYHEEWLRNQSKSFFRN